MKGLRIIVTGGTIDKVHDVQLEGLAFDSRGATHIPELLLESRCYFPVIELLMLKDSLEFDDSDRAAIAAAVNASPEHAVVLTHGTSTMGHTARFLETKIQKKTVVLTGAMRPLSLAASDGGFNLGAVIIAAQCLPSGVWGTMNGRVFPASKLSKNLNTGRFDC